ncbi:MAG: hypothetical protein K2U26_09115 [Cyclobacteriaceae bacterium]|nr:hypothetical protein [Cyclobacteriaceae bacterium]
MISALGRLHPLIVHLPIGILLLAFLFELLSYTRKYRRLRFAVRPALFWGAFFAVLAAFSGYQLAEEGGYDDQLLKFHQYSGIGTAVLAVLVYLHRKYSIIKNKVQRRFLRLFLFCVLVVLLSTAGHLGGSLTHGEDFLFPGSSPVEAVPVKPVSMANPAKANVYTDVVRPLLEAKCYGCHSSKKQKGQLRLDARELIEKGGKHGVVLVAGKPAESELWKRMVLPIEDEDHMPPRERDQLTSIEVDIIERWIEAGAPYDKTLEEIGSPPAIMEYLKSSGDESANDLPAEEIDPAGEDAVSKLRKTGVLVLPISANTNYVQVSFASVKKFSEADGEALRSIGKNIVQLNLSGCELSPKALSIAADLPNLRKLNLERSSVTDDNLRDIVWPSDLSFLNLSFTKVTDAGLANMKSIAHLKTIYLFQSTVTKKGVDELHQLLPDLKIDTGNYSLPLLASDTTRFKRGKY